MTTSDCIEIRTMRHLCHKFQSPFSRLLRSYLDSGDYLALVKVPFSPADYSDAVAFRRDYLLYSFLRKWLGFDTLVDKKAAATQGFFSCEVANKETNVRLKSPCPGNPDVDAVIFMAQRKVAEVLGTFDFSLVEPLCRWSGGATYDLRRGTSLAQKHSDVITVTPDAWPYLARSIGSDIRWFAVRYAVEIEGPCTPLKDKTVKFVRGGKFITVPKTALVDRGIDPQPTGNGFLQQGAGRYIRQRLKRVGVDLEDQSRNKGLAAVAIEKSLATVDLSSASDTLSTEMVATLLPLDWFLFLDRIRSRFTRVDGKWIRLEKFSAMGNAFTFELESLCFWTLAEATCKYLGLSVSDVSVFGDDIIIPRDAYGLLRKVFAHCGFTINEEKSFTSGSFFESCGGHYFLGTDVTPVYQKHVVSDKLEEIIRMHNRLSRWATRTGENLDDVLSRLIDYAISTRKGSKHAFKLPRIPRVCLDDDGFLSADTDLGVYDPNHGYYCDLWTATPRLRYDRYEAAYYAYKLRHPTTLSPHPKGWGWFRSDSAVRYRASKGWRHGAG